MSRSVLEVGWQRQSVLAGDGVASRRENAVIRAVNEAGAYRCLSRAGTRVAPDLLDIAIVHPLPSTCVGGHAGGAPVAARGATAAVVVGELRATLVTCSPQVTDGRRRPIHPWAPRPNLEVGPVSPQLPLVLRPNIDARSDISVRRQLVGLVVPRRWAHGAPRATARRHSQCGARACLRTSARRTAPAATEFATASSGQAPGSRESARSV
jgi:hypothetical protein